MIFNFPLLIHKNNSNKNSSLLLLEIILRLMITLILTGKKYVLQIYKIELHTKNHVDWIKNEVPREV